MNEEPKIPSTAQSIRVDIVSDVMCPWCYIGKRRLEAAMSLLAPEIDVQVHWLPYQLDPTLPAEGKDRKQYLAEKFGGLEKALSFYQTIKQAGDGEGIPFDFDAIKVSPNTLDAHRMIYWAGQQSLAVQDKMVEALFKAYFIDGQHLGDRNVLKTVAQSAGQDGDHMKARLESDDDVALVQSVIAGATYAGVTGVPFFILGEKYSMSGAHPAEALAETIRRIAEQAAA